MRDRNSRTVLHVIVACVVVLALAACSAETRQKILSTFFDGTDRPPPPTTRVRRDRDREIDELKRKLAEAEQNLAAAQETAKGKGAERIIPPAEKAKSWEEAEKALPRSKAGQVDWVQALKAGAIAPRPGIVAGATDQPVLPITVERVPKAAAIFKVVYPHEPHTVVLSCDNCHPAFFEMQRGATPISMTKIFAGEYCGACHGKVAFDVITNCPRCHVNLVPSEENGVEADLAKAQASTVPSSAEIIERGKTVYLEACVVCHGEKGDGKGPLAASLDPKPRDFTAGKYKFRSTPSGSIPTDFDLFRTITQGLFGTSMPGFSKLAYEDRWALVHFIKRFSQQFAKPQPAKSILIPDPPAKTSELLQVGKKLYIEAGCNSCHGDTGNGDGPSAPDLKDDWGNPLRPFDFVTGVSAKRGSTPKDIYRTIMTGLQGTPMPDYGDVFENEQPWAVIYYVLSLRDEKSKMASGVKGDIVLQRKAGEGGVPLAVFPHWFHRIRFKCYACHPSITEMKAGANNITMDAIREGKFCGACHNGKIAWEVSFNTCPRCHVGK